MLADKEALKMAVKLKNYCGRKENCTQCVFYCGDECRITTGESPCWWEIESRWEERDVDLAKALTSFGITEVICHCGSSYWEDGDNMVKLPKNAFCAARHGETLKLDEIIKENEIKLSGKDVYKRQALVSAPAVHTEVTLVVEYGI